MKTNYTNYIHSILKKQQHRVQLGLDQANRKIRFTKGEVDTLSGEFAAPLTGPRKVSACHKLTASCQVRTRCVKSPRTS